MEIENRNGEGNIAFIVDDIEGDMGRDTVMKLIQQADGNVIITIKKLCEEPVSIEFCSSSGGGRRPIIAKKLRELVAELAKDEVLKTINPIARMKIDECTAENPCCDRRGEYNGYASGVILFKCPKHCSCHD